MAKDSILIICAHSDDQMIGVGGTIAKYSEEGIECIIIVSSYGEKSHIWLKKDEIAKVRVKESETAAKIVGAKKTIFFDLREGCFEEDIKKENYEEKVKKLIKKYKPIKIFTHSINDAHADHRAISRIVTDMCKDVKYKGDLYSFDVWTAIKIKQREAPVMYVDISKQFGKKIKAVKAFKSQTPSIVSLLWSIYLKAIKNGFRDRCRFAESFQKIDFDKNE